jgi:hypothetical protein
MFTTECHRVLSPRQIRLHRLETNPMCTGGWKVSQQIPGERNSHRHSLPKSSVVSRATGKNCREQAIFDCLYRLSELPDRPPRELPRTLGP